MKDYEVKELEILRKAIDKVQEREGKKKIQNNLVQDIINIVENFLRIKKLICYGGTAINNILPKEFQFYNKEVELPDYDFFSPTPLKDVKELANIYYKKGYTEIEAKAGVHPGTFKVFVNFIPIADITFLDDEIYKKLQKGAIKVDGIYYASPDYLRMAMYLELSRPLGDTSRWEKILKRLTLLNRYHPLKGTNCNNIDIQRMFETNYDERDIFYIVRDALINNGAVFFGAFANRLYLRNLKQFHRRNFAKIPDFDVLSEEPKKTADYVAGALEFSGLKQVKIIKRNGIGEIIAPHYEVKVGSETLVFVYEPLACHSYNYIRINNRKVKIATIDTMLSFYLAFIFANRTYYNPERIRCMSYYLFEVQKYNRLKQKGILRRFSINCYGNQNTLQTLREEKAKKYKELKSKRGTRAWEWYFLRYIPGEEKKTRKKKSRKAKKQHKAKKSRKSRKLWIF